MSCLSDKSSLFAVYVWIRGPRMQENVHFHKIGFSMDRLLTDLFLIIFGDPAVDACIIGIPLFYNF